MSKIIIKNGQCNIIDEEDSDFLRVLDDALSFLVPGAIYSKAYKGYIDSEGNFNKWDGRKRLLSRSLEFPYGLLDRVLEVYDNFGKTVEVVDTREPKTPATPIDILSKLSAMGKNPYPYQIEAMEAAIKKDCGIIRLATGGGKSILAGLITAALGKKTIIYVIGTDLLYQMHKLFSSLFDIKIGIIGDGHCEIGDINIATVWTIGRALDLKVTKSEDQGVESDVDRSKFNEIRSLLYSTKVHIIDECHLAACDTIQGIAKFINPEHIYGMSASPWRDDNADLLIESILGRRIVDISASKLIDGGFLVQPYIKFITVPKPINKLPSNYQTIYRKYIVENQERNNLVIKGAEKLVEQNYPTLVLFSSVEHGNYLYNELKNRIPCALLSGKDDSKTREEVKDNLESGKIKCIVASKIFDIGVDLPTLSGLVIASSGKSSVRALQRIGRVIRKHPGKTNAAIIDFADQVKYLDKHSKDRFKIYSSEERFIVQWPKKK